MQGFAIWLTGLPSSGKTTLASSLACTMRGQGLPTVILDGDDLRHGLSADLGFSAQDRREQARRVVHLCQLLLSNGIVAIVPLISPYQDSRQAARDTLGKFVEVYVRCPVEECMRRDIKGLYTKALKGEILEFTGVSDPYEKPEFPEVTVDTDVLSVEECCHRILNALYSLNYTAAGTDKSGVDGGG